ncbi:MAG: inositol monophosphatase family protein [Ilumatobacteraceae bacterium]
MTPEALAELFRTIADAVGAALRDVEDWGPSGRRDGQYAADLIADAVVLEALRAEGLSILSEESGLEEAGSPVMVIVDPLDGSTNASRGLPWYATSLCAIDAEGPLVALVRNQAVGTTYEAIRGRGASRDGLALESGGSGCREIHEAIVGMSGLAPRHLGWAQFRAMHASALDLCAVADGTLDGFVDCSHDAHGVWDYAGAMLVCREVGITVVDAFGRELIGRDPEVRRTPLAAATPDLQEFLVASRRSW